MALAVPLLDVCLSIVRRWLRGQPIFRGDRSHIHHKLLERGLTHRRVVMLLYGVAGLCAATSLIQSLVPERLAVLVIVLFCGAIWAGVARLGYLEFHGAWRAIAASSLRRSIQGEMAVEAVEERIRHAATVDACWEAVRDASRQLGFSQIEANFDGHLFRDDQTITPPNSCWQLRVPLAETSYVQVGRSVHAGPEPAALLPFVDLLRRRLRPRLLSIQTNHVAEAAPTFLTLDDPARGLIELAAKLEHEDATTRDRVPQ